MRRRIASPTPELAPCSLFSKPGKWVRVHATLYETAHLEIVSTALGDNFELKLELSPNTTVSASAFKGHQQCLVLSGFDRHPQTKRIFDCVKLDIRNRWQAKLIEAISKPHQPKEQRSQVRPTR